MKHFYQNIPGHFHPEQKLCYKNQIRQAKEALTTCAAKV
jgi:hypothetical protein